jgi:hypothetical protein
MRITLSWAWTDNEGVEHTGGDTVDVDDATARQLIRDGHAQIAPDVQATPTDAATAAENVSAAAHEPTDATAAAAGAGDKSPAQPTPKSPDEGDTSEGVS